MQLLKSIRKIFDSNEGKGFFSSSSFSKHWTSLPNFEKPGTARTWASYDTIFTVDFQAAKTYLAMEHLSTLNGRSSAS